MRPRTVWCLMAMAAALPACRPARDPASESAELAAREARLAQRLAVPAESGGPLSPVARWVLPRELGEISGLALTADGRLLTHNDEVGRITVIDPRRGVVLKRFALGASSADMPRGDFEGITVANGGIVLLASNGTLHEFREGADGEQVPYTVTDTRLGKECEFEGVAFDSAAGSLLLPCKRVDTKALRDQLVIYRWSLRSAETRFTQLTIPLARAVGSNGWKSLHPSDITVDPASGHYVIVASQEKALVEVTPSGEVVRSLRLPAVHHQAEGVAISADGLLIVSDEAGNRSASITLYRWPLTVASLSSR